VTGSPQYSQGPTTGPFLNYSIPEFHTVSFTSILILSFNVRLVLSSDVACTSLVIVYVEQAASERDHFHVAYVVHTYICAKRVLECNDVPGRWGTYFCGLFFSRGEFSGREEGLGGCHHVPTNRACQKQSGREEPSSIEKVWWVKDVEKTEKCSTWDEECSFLYAQFLAQMLLAVNCCITCPTNLSWQFLYMSYFFLGFSREETNSCCSLLCYDAV
jgi:hypothetical protein